MPVNAMPVVNAYLKPLRLCNFATNCSSEPLSALQNDIRKGLTFHTEVHEHKHTEVPWNRIVQSLVQFANAYSKMFE